MSFVNLIMIGFLFVGYKVSYYVRIFELLNGKKQVY